MTITIGWWALPALLTVAALVWSMASPSRSNPYGYGDIGGAIVALFVIIGLLVAWLIWAVLT